MRPAELLVLACGLVVVGFQLVLFFQPGGPVPAEASQVDARLEATVQRALRHNLRLNELFQELDASLGAAQAGRAAQAERAGERAREAVALGEAVDRALGRAGEGSEDAAAVEGAVRRLAPKAKGAAYPSGSEEGPCVGGPLDTAGAVAAVVTVTFDRPDYLQRHLASLLAVHGRRPANGVEFPLFISQDGTPPSEAVAALARSHGANISYLHHQELRPPQPRDRSEKLAYYRIAAHYRFILKTLFDCFGYPRVIFLEDDMELAPDFFGYFRATAPLLAADPSLLCVSSWNDHGQDRYVRDARLLFRSDFFPGLGWMLQRSLWDEWREVWPGSYWDDWIRLAKTRRGRQCIRPEVCRTYNYGEVGTSRGQYFRRYLAPVRLNEEDVAWGAEDLSYLNATRYKRDFWEAVRGATVLASVGEALGFGEGDVALLYGSQEAYEDITGALGMLREWKDGVPRAAYEGVVTVWQGKTRIFIAPAASLEPPKKEPLEGPDMHDATGALVHERPALYTDRRQ